MQPCRVIVLLSPISFDSGNTQLPPSTPPLPIAEGSSPALPSFLALASALYPAPPVCLRR